jgi:hypothetical protein
MTKRRFVEVYDTPSGMGGSHTVEIVEESAGDRVKVRVWYGRPTPNGWERWRDWDGFTFEAAKIALTNRRRMALYKSS